MHDAKRMQIMKTCHYICSKIANNYFWKRPILLYKMLQSSTSAKFHNKP